MEIQSQNVLKIAAKGWLLLFTMAFMWPLSAQSQVLPFRTYSIEKGLSEAVVHAMMQDHDGYIWIATGYGLNRFDGLSFKKYYAEDGLSNNKVYTVFESSDQRIWVGTGSGVNIIESDTVITPAVVSPLQENTILDIYEDQNGEFWFATDGQGVWHLDNSDQLVQFSTANGLANNRVRSIKEDANGTLWFGTRGGLSRLQNGNFRTYRPRDGLADEKIRALALDQNQHGIWIATRGGLSYFDGRQFTNYTEAEGLVNNRIQAISTDSSGGLWLGTEEGVSYFKNGRFTSYTAADGLPNSIIHATLYDRENNIWFGTFGGGINLFLGNAITNYRSEQGLPNEVVTSISQAPDGTHWVTTYGGGIVTIRGDSTRVINTANGLIDNKVYTGRWDRQNRYVIGTRWGLSIYDAGRFTNYDEAKLPHRKIRAITPTKTENEYWLGTYGEGALHFTANGFKQITQEQGLANNTVLAVEEGPDGAIWFATYGGLSRFKNGNFTIYTIKDGLPNNGVLDIHFTPNGTLWVSTFGGVAYMQGSGFSSITPEDGLPDDVCYFIIQDNDHRFWIGTNKGVVRFDFEKWQALDSSNKGTAFKVITQNQGLVGNEMNAGAGFKDAQGRLWFGSVSGLTEFRPERAVENKVAPVVHINEIRVGNRVVGDSEQLSLPSTDRSITISFVGIDFSAPEQVVYEYRLKNSGDEWQQTTRPQVRYSALLPGDYTFEVRARNSEGVWSPQKATLPFTVEPPFWFQWWFIALIIVLLLGALLFIYNYYRVKQLVEMERMRVRIASDLHDDVGSSLTEIALQSDFIQTTDASDELKESIRQIGTQSRKIVSGLDDIVWSIDARNDTVGDLTDRMQDYANTVLPNRKIAYQFEGLSMDRTLSVPVKENLYLIYKEAINNIAKHSNATKVDVAVSNNGGDVELKIHDNGTNVSKNRKSGHGLRNMNMRAQRIDSIVTFRNDNGFTVHLRKQ